MKKVCSASQNVQTQFVWHLRFQDYFDTFKTGKTGLSWLILCIMESIANLLTVFSRGNASDANTTAFFEKLDHPKLLKLMIAYLENSAENIGNPKITSTQALNDKGVDILLEFPDGARIGIQIKSPSDVKAASFSADVKRQMAESHTHYINKWLLFICSPLEAGKVKFDQKVGHLLNELSGFKTDYIVVYSPQQACNILNTGIMTVADFDRIKMQFPKASEDKLSAKPAFALATQNKAVAAKTATRLLAYQGLSEDFREDTLSVLNQFQTLLKKLTQKSRIFLFHCLERSKQYGYSRSSFGPMCTDLEHYLASSMEEIKREVKVLENYNVASFDEDTDGEWHIALHHKKFDYNVWEEVVEYCHKTGASLKDIVVNMDFSNFD